MPGKVFISYRVADTRTTAGRLAGDLRHVFGDGAVFLDYRSLDAAEQWPEQLRAEVAGAAAVVVLIGKEWLTAQDEYGRRRLDVADDWVRQEVAAALRGDGKVLPLLVNDAKALPAAAIENLPDIVALATAQARPLRDTDWEADVAGLVEWLETQGLERVVIPVGQDEATPPAPRWRGNPYRGLSAFGPDDGAIYHGRERDSDELLRRVEGERVVAVIGSSGSGKSSLVAAGLLPQLGQDWVWVRFTPAEAGDNPLRALARKLAPHCSSTGSADELAERLRSAPEDMDAVAAEALAGAAPGAQLLLFADQFEELFTARVDEAHRTALVDLIAAVGRSQHTRLVLTLRADYTEHCTRYESLTAQLRSGTFLLGSPGVSALKTMIEGPAQAAGLIVEPTLVDRILDEAGTEPGALALVEFTLAQLYDARSDGTLTLAAYNNLDGVGGAIEAQGERAVHDVGAQATEAALGNVFRALAAVNEHSGAVRKRAPLEALKAGERAIVDRLVKARLLVTDTDAEGVAAVEVAHEAVLRHWTRFARWLDDNRALELWRQRLATYHTGGALLPRGAPLTTALEWLRTRADDLGEAERTYIVRSRGAARRFNAWVTAGVVSVLLVIGAVGAFTVWTARAGLNTDAGLAALAFRAGLGGFTELPVPEMMAIPAGSFTMGSPATEQGHRDDEGPPRNVAISPFAMGKFEVTFAEYDAFAKATGRRLPDDEGWGRGRRPVINVSWNDANAYAAWLLLMTGKQYRLPTEAEWEYGARAGSTSRYWWGDEVGEGRANCAYCGGRWDGKQTAPVGSFPANAFGLGDTAGNVREWVQDCYVDTETADCGRRVLRGGSWFSVPVFMRSAFRGAFGTGHAGYGVGFRLAHDR